ncbi:MAG: hypothetical protein F4Z57_01795 [Gemmatimonadetes bacterium]|nr:hypothetical protein [Gemmatimonadota bacterium]
MQRLILCLCIAAGPVAAARAELTSLIDSPTAGLVNKGHYAVNVHLFADGGAVGRLHVGVLKRLSVGVSFGGEQLIGTGAVDWYPRVGLAARCRIIEEGYTWPALLLGFDSQGIGPYRDQRYQVKSKGIYLVLSKNYTSMLGELGVHAGVNMSREDADDGDWSAWLGIDKSLRFMALFGEYVLGRYNGLRDQGVAEGYLNIGGAWTVAPQLRVAYYFKNALGSDHFGSQSIRELSVTYRRKFR